MRIRAMVIRIIRQFLRDKRTIGLMLVAPMFILWLMSLVFDGNEYTPTIGMVDVPDMLLEQLEEENVELLSINQEEAETKLTEQEIDAFIIMDQNVPHISLEGSDPTVNKAVLLSIQQAFQQLENEQQSLIKPEFTYLHGSDEMALFDNIGPFLIGYFAFFFVFLIAGVSFLRERTSGTLDRILSTPLKRWEMVIGYALGYGIFTTVQATIIVFFSIEILDIIMVGSIWYVLLITFLLSLTALTLGTFLSAFANNELQMIQFIPLVIIPQVFFSGLFHLETMAPWLQSLSVIMPMTYGGDAMRDIMIRGGGWADIQIDVFVLLGFSLLFMVLNVVALKKHRRL
ncbi:ABC transporter permease [Bacillus sp. SM2101]|uniref:ABC transporter permease n=1 Tax=Bacillus sp. SM2101 TaxID=2805366 RepID=UPI001BDE1CDA|nr:ABC transporter permease [Bacillus sp. SM2101]